MNRHPFPNMDELLQRLLDDKLEPKEMGRLQKAICEDPRVRDYYLDSMLVCAVLRRSSQVTGELSETDLIEALSARGKVGKKRIAKPLFSIAAVVVLGLAIFVAWRLLPHRAQGPVMGRLAGVYEAQWQGTRPGVGDSLYAGRYELSEGVAKLDVGQGISLLLEAPCNVDLTGANKVTLETGRLAVLVPPEEKGFQVRTPTALITDLGTEFGVIAHGDGSTEAHVLKGRVPMALQPQSRRRATPLVVTEGRAASVDSVGRAIVGEMVAQTDLFLRQLPSAVESSEPSGQLNLADLVGGGNGLGTGSLDQGIDLGTGKVFRHPVLDISHTLPNGFQRTPQYRGIDGVFVPNGPVEMSSTGLVFSGCPRTRGSFFGGPANGAKFYDLVHRRTHSVRLNGVPVGTIRHPALSLHANAGITFDLDQIRRDHPGLDIDHFGALCGIPKDLPHPRFSHADVWILMDGDLHLQLHFPREQGVFQSVELPILPQNRFLTLVSTCAGRADYSWIVFNHPFLGPAIPTTQVVNP